MAEAVVFGANGFIGSHLVDSLAERGHEVRAFDRFSSTRQSFHKSDAVEVFPGDYMNRADIKDAVSGAETVFHFISTTTPATAENDPAIDIETNVRMSVELLKQCVDAGVKKVVFASSGGAIYGNYENDGRYKETDPTLPISPYAIGKLAIESYLRYFDVKHGLESMTFRIANPYGERQPFHRKQGVIPIFLEHMQKGEPITILGDGSMTRDYIYAKDMTDMIADAYQQDNKEQVYNIGSGVGTSVTEILETAEAVTGIIPDVNHKPIPPTYIEHAVLDTNRFTAEFGAKPQTTLKIGMAATYNYIKEIIDDK